MYFSFRIRLLELEGVSSKQTYLGVVEQLITENDNYKHQAARENCSDVIIKVIVIILIVIARTNVRTLALIRYI